MATYWVIPPPVIHGDRILSLVTNPLGRKSKYKWNLLICE